MFYSPAAMKKLIVAAVLTLAACILGITTQTTRAMKIRDECISAFVTDSDREKCHVYYKNAEAFAGAMFTAGLLMSCMQAYAYSIENIRQTKRCYIPLGIIPAVQISSLVLNSVAIYRENAVCMNTALVLDALSWSLIFGFLISEEKGHVGFEDL